METRSDQFEFAKSHFFDTSGWSSFCAITLTLKQARRSEGALKSFSSRGAQAAGWRKPSGRLFSGKLRPPTQSNYVLEHIVRPPSLLNVPARNRSVPELLWKTCKGCDATIIAAEAVDVRGLDMKFVSLFALLLATSPVAAQTPGTPSSQICTEDPTLRRRRCGDAKHNDDGKWNEQLGVERWFRWRQFKWGQFRRRSRFDAGDTQLPMRRWHAYGCVGHMQLIGGCRDTNPSRPA
jgi:hypothetical protein